MPQSMAMSWMTYPTGGGKPRIEQYRDGVGRQWRVFIPVAGPVVDDNGHAALKGHQSYHYVYAGRASTWRAAMGAVAHWYKTREALL